MLVVIWHYYRLYVEIPTGVHCNHRMVSALSFICVCVSVIVFVFVFVLAYRALKTLLMDAILTFSKQSLCLKEACFRHTEMLYTWKKTLSNNFLIGTALFPCNGIIVHLNMQNAE